MFAVDGEYSEETDRMVENLTQEELLFRINNVNMSGIFLRESDFTSYLGGIERDAATGKIVGAKATSMRWFGKANVTAIKVMMSKRGEDLGMHQQPVRKVAFFIPYSAGNQKKKTPKNKYSSVGRCTNP